MKYLKEYLTAISSILLAFILLSCGASHHLSSNTPYKDESFHYPLLKKNGMIVAGVSSQQIKLSYEDRIKYGSALSNVLLDKLKDVHLIHITNTDQLINRMGKLQYFDMMESFDQKKILNMEIMSQLKDSIPDAEYILLGYIENENIMDESIDETIKDEEGKEKLQTEYKKIYILTVEFQIYDLSQEKKVWSNIIYNQAEHSETRETRTGCMESCIDNLFLNILQGEPAEISRDEVLVRIYEKLAKDLSKS
jgi:hypothetical protein